MDALPTSSLMEDWAVWYAQHGFAVFPLHTIHQGGCSCRRAQCEHPGKHPRIPRRDGGKGVYDATCDVAQVIAWWQKWPMGNIGIAAGAASNLLVLDVDPAHTGDTSLRALERQHTPLPETPRSLTGGGGEHYCFLHPEAPIRNAVGLAPGLDIRSDGGYIVAPPSRHISGKPYAWDVGVPLEDVPLALCPTWLITLCHAQRKRGAHTPGTPIPAGQRNTVLASEAGKLRRMGFPSNVITAALKELNATACDPPLASTEVEAIAQSIGTYPPEDFTQHPHLKTSKNGVTPPQRTTPYGDVFNAEALQRLYGTQLRYCQKIGGWLVWTGTHWQRDEQSQIMQYARETIRAVMNEAIDTHNPDLAKFAGKCLGHSRLTAMVAQAATLPGLAVDSTIFDTDIWMLNCQNGTLNLQTGVSGAHRQEDYITRCIDVAYDSHARCPTWDAFLWRVMGGHTDAPRATRLITFLQRAVGYALTGVTQEDVLFLLYGNGRNGKSRFLDACHQLLTGYAKTAQMTSFLHQDRETVRNDLADLYGVRFVSAIETTEGKRFSEGLIKQLTGGDRIKARFLFREYFEFLPQFKIFLAFNHRPDIHETDNAIWERIRLIPFEVYIPPEERDKQLSAKLCAELPGILAWAIQGCLDWQREGLGEPEEVTEATNTYRREQDQIGRFLEEKCYTAAGNTSVRIKAKDLYGAYKEWCNETGEREHTQHAFGRYLSAKGFPPIAGGHNVQFRTGIGLQNLAQGTEV